MLPSHLLPAPEGSPRFPAASPLPLLLRLAAWLSRHRYGKVLGIIPYVYGWLPALVLPHAMLLHLAARRLPLSKRLRSLVEVHVSRANGCSFCTDVHAALAIEGGVPAAVFDELGDVRASTALDEREKAALAWALEAARPGASAEEALADARRHFDDRALVALAWLASFMTYLNTLAKAVGLSSAGLCELARRERRG